MIPVTKTFFPKKEEYQKYIDQIWSNEWLTNRGELVKELEDRLTRFLGVNNVTLTTNGTLPIQIALKVMAGKGEVITTPFSYVATTSSIIWESCKPVFVDIDPKHLTIDETKIEEAITNNTTVILATHVFGNPCNVEAIQKIADKHGLKVIFDAAHCFGVEYKGESIFNYGDVSTCSFHATKIFHTGEGGGMFCKDEELNNKLFYSHNFGHNGPTDFYGLGINAKMSELQAGMGLAVLPHMNEIFQSRKEIVEFYDNYLDEPIRKIQIRKETLWNYSYYPVLFENEQILLKIQENLNAQGIFPRRYFFPSLNTLKYVKGSKMKISEEVANTILCLPVYHNLKQQELKTIVDIINKSLIQTS